MKLNDVAIDLDEVIAVTPNYNSEGWPWNLKEIESGSLIYFKNGKNIYSKNNAEVLFHLMKEEWSNS